MSQEDAIPEATVKALSGMAKDIAKAVQDSTDPSTRPGHAGVTESAQPDLKRFMHKSVGGSGFLPANDRTPSEQRMKIEGAVKEGFNINLFPQGDLDNFSLSRYVMAMERARNTAEGGTAFQKWAPWETQYYYAWERLATTKAMGDMVSGQDGGFLAPELWSTRFIDQIYPQMALSRVPVTRVPMGTRVVHIPRLSSNIAITYTAEQGAITANQAQLEQLSFTARKQTFLVQISNELIRDSAPQADMILTRNATNYLAIDRDKQALLGTGQAGAPTGLLNQSNISTTTVTPTNTTSIASFASAGGHAGTSPTYLDFWNAIINVENLNGSTNVPLAQAACTGIVGPVALKQQIMSMKDSNGRPIYDFGVNQMRGNFKPTNDSNAGPSATPYTQLDGLFGVPIVLTNILAGTEGSRNAFFGDWQHLWIMERQDVEILSSNVAGTAFQNDQTWIRGIARYDVGVAHKEPFYVVTNV